jgi:hypothetical protein
LNEFDEITQALEALGDLAASVAGTDLQTIPGDDAQRLTIGYRLVSRKLLHELARCKDVSPSAIVRLLHDWLVGSHT